MSKRFDLEANREFLESMGIKVPRPSPPVEKTVRPEKRYTGPSKGNANDPTLAFFGASFTDPIMSWQYNQRSTKVRKVTHIYEYGELTPDEPIVIIQHNHKFNEPCSPWNFCHRVENA